MADRGEIEEVWVNEDGCNWFLCDIPRIDTDAYIVTLEHQKEPCFRRYCKEHAQKAGKTYKVMRRKENGTLVSNPN